MNTTYVKLPNGSIVNGSIVAVDQGCVQISVTVTLDELMNTTPETVCSRWPMPSPVVGGHALELCVTGKLDLSQVEPVSVTDCSSEVKRGFQVTITRIGCGHRTLSVRARNALEAKRLAEGVAGDFVYSESSSEYEFDVQECT